MNYSFNELKKKTVIDVKDGKKLGKVSDLTVSFPKNCFESITITPSCVNLFSQDKLIISPCDIQRIGEDAILVKISEKGDKVQSLHEEFCDEE